MFPLFLFLASLIEPNPIAVVYTPNSVLDRLPAEEVRFAGGRPRYSTCTGVAWLGDNQYIAAVGLTTSSIQIYKFNAEDFSLVPHSYFDNRDLLSLSRPENLAFSADNQLLAIPNMKSGHVNIYAVDRSSFIDSSPGKPLFVIKACQAHSARFSPDGKYLAYVTTDDPGTIALYQVAKDEYHRYHLEKKQQIRNPFFPLKPKSIDFTKDSRYVVIGFCMQVLPIEGRADGMLACYKFNQQAGLIDTKVVSHLRGLYSTETILLDAENKHVLAVDQINDRVTVHDFDLLTGKIGKECPGLNNPAAQLNFPHGMALSSDGRFLAVSNYGDDKVTVYQVHYSK